MYCGTTKVIELHLSRDDANDYLNSMAVRGMDYEVELHRGRGNDFVISLRSNNKSLCG